MDPMQALRLQMQQMALGTSAPEAPTPNQTTVVAPHIQPKAPSFEKYRILSNHTVERQSDLQQPRKREKEKKIHGWLSSLLSEKGSTTNPLQSCISPGLTHLPHHLQKTETPKYTTDGWREIHNTAPLCRTLRFDTKNPMNFLNKLEVLGYRDEKIALFIEWSPKDPTQHIFELLDKNGFLHDFIGRYLAKDLGNYQESDIEKMKALVALLFADGQISEEIRDKISPYIQKGSWKL